MTLTFLSLSLSVISTGRAWSTARPAAVCVRKARCTSGGVSPANPGIRWASGKPSLLLITADLPDLSVSHVGKESAWRIKVNCSDALYWWGYKLLSKRLWPPCRRTACFRRVRFPFTRECYRLNATQYESFYLACSKVCTPHRLIHFHESDLYYI